MIRILSSLGFWSISVLYIRVSGFFFFSCSFVHVRARSAPRWIDQPPILDFPGQESKRPFKIQLWMGCEKKNRFVGVHEKIWPTGYDFVDSICPKCVQVPRPDIPPPSQDDHQVGCWIILDIGGNSSWSDKDCPWRREIMFSNKDVECISKA